MFGNNDKIAALELRVLDLENQARVLIEQNEGLLKDVAELQRGTSLQPVVRYGRVMDFLYNPGGAINRVPIGKAVKLLADHIGVEFGVTEQKDAEVVLEKVKRARK